MSPQTLAFTVVMMALVTWIPRTLPISLLAGRKLPEIATQTLSHLPVAILAALLAVQIFAPGNKLSLSVSNPYIWAAILPALIAIKTRSLFLTVITGVSCLSLLRIFVF